MKFKTTIMTMVFSGLIFLVSGQGILINPEDLKGDISIGAVQYHVTPENSSNLGLHLGVSIWKIYFDMSTNLAFGWGEKLDITSSENYSKKREEIIAGNLGFIAATFFKGKRVEIELIPVIGYYSMYNIYQDPDGYDSMSFFTTFEDDNVNAGVVFRTTFNKNLGILLGISTMERYKMGLSIRIKEKIKIPLED